MTRNTEKLRNHGKLCRLGLAAATAVALLAWMPTPAAAQDCFSMNPTDWPQPAKPYFMIGFDTSGSMGWDTGLPGNSCGYDSLAGGGSAPVDHGRCALFNTLNAFAGQVNFGLASFPATRSCSNPCYTACTTTYPYGSSCGSGSGNTRRGALILEPMLIDDPAEPDNLAALLSWVDNDCSGYNEIFAMGGTPLNGILRDMYRYFTGTYTDPISGAIPSPLRTTANGEMACRSLNVILVTDGDEGCDSTTYTYDAAADLYNGFTYNGIFWRVRTHVIDFGGGGGTTADNIADAGDDGIYNNGTAQAVFAGDEVQLSQAMADIIFSAIEPETCNNADDNCNGCVDEGYVHYCNTGQTCCTWSTPGQRTTCLNSYEASIATNPPDGDLTLLPCTTPTQQGQAANWLCYNPHETCDGADNNCDGTVDEEVLTCGNPAHCPTTETCNGEDDDCDGFIDEGGVCGSCVPSAEVCNGCDDDCDGVVDNGTFAPIACGLPSPANCVGTMNCQAPVSVGTPGTCVSGAGYTACTNNPQAEICDCVDNDCNGIADDGLGSVDCVPSTHPGGLFYSDTNPDSQCEYGFTVCQGCVDDCVGGVGPTTEVCDNIDNDCNGTVDDNVFGVGLPCGTNNPPCTTGTTACVNGQLICQGGSTGTPEVCNGLDDDCDTILDNPPLDDAPGPGLTGCWDEPGNCCSHQGYTWCPPAGASCHDASDLEPPCAAGTLVCDGANGWICQGMQTPQPEQCDGLDNDCNGEVDDFAVCPLPNEHCVEGSCRSECNPADEFPCPPGESCREETINGQVVYVCMPGTGDCGGTTCAEGWVCVDQGNGLVCVDPCDPNPCQAWEDCWLGGCSDNSCTGIGQSCPSGQYCVDHECIDDPCPAAGCDPLTQACVRDCDAQSCTATCVDACTCAQGQTCDESGGCVADLCHEVTCDLGEACDPATGICGADDCAAVICGQYEVCTGGVCIDDPCLVVSCPEFYECVLRETADSTALRTLCEPGDAFWVPGGGGGSLTAGGGGCACQSTSPPLGAGLPLILVLGLLLWRRQESREGGPR